MVAAEAAAYGIPVVAARKGGLAEIISDAETGFLVNPQSPFELAKKLRFLIEDRGLRRKMGDSARDFALKHLGQDRMVEEMETLMESLNHD